MSPGQNHEAPPLLSLRGLRVEAPGSLTLLDGIDLEIRAGEILCLVGESGCGKSLTALSIPRLLPTGLHRVAGSIRWRGRELTELNEPALRALRGAEIGFIFQEPMSSLNPVLTVGVQITETLRAHGRSSRAAARRRAAELLAEVGVPDASGRLGSYPHELSGGLRQRVMIAMALACDPSLLIADEPSTALDVSVQAQVLDLLRSLRDRRELAILFVTHDLGVVAELGQRVLVMYAGQIVEAAPVPELFAHPLHPYTRALLDSLPRLEGESMPTGIPGTVPRPGLAPSGCRFRDRCSMAASVCEGEQVLRVLDSGRALRCCRGEEVGP